MAEVQKCSGILGTTTEVLDIHDGELMVTIEIATDDEAFTYNARVNRLNPISAHKMIVKAVNNGVAPEKIAAALNRKVKEIRDSLSLLDGINAEAVDLLKATPIAPGAIKQIKKVTGVRQIEIAELMGSANNFTKSYAEALVLSTPKDQFLVAEEPKKTKGLSREDLAKMEEEMQAIERDLKAVEESYGEDMLNLTLAKGYIKKLLENARVMKFLSTNYAEFCSEFQTMLAETL